MGKAASSLLIISIALITVYADVDVHGKSDLQSTITVPDNVCMRPFTVHIESDINNLRFHCKSKDDDLGDVTRNAGEEFDIRFCLNFWRSTLYFCRFYWESKQRVLDVFAVKGKHDPENCFSGARIAEMNCYWMVKEDGFYVGTFINPGPKDWVKRFDWE